MVNFISMFPVYLLGFFILTWLSTAYWGLKYTELITDYKEMPAIVKVIVWIMIPFIVLISCIFYWETSTIFVNNGYHLYPNFTCIVLAWIMFLILSVVIYYGYLSNRCKIDSIEKSVVDLCSWIAYILLTLLEVWTAVDALVYIRNWF